MDPPPNNDKLDFGLPLSPRSNYASPYLNFNPAYLPSTQPEYILPEGANKQRGRFELAFSQIGASCMIGAMIGGTGGFYNGLKKTTLAGQTAKLRTTEMINHVMKQGAASANALGVVAVMYSGFGVLLAWARETEDDLNTLTAATATGLLYRCQGGLRAAGIGGAVGLGIASLYCLWNSRDRLQSGFSQNYSSL
uniref:Mitochondrial import inner membrane translocase subunit TIM23 n=1 Tax=Clastoptera arizonana TaxID=38151 RepID=A0A1B6E9L1_9HEMI